MYVLSLGEASDRSRIVLLLPRREMGGGGAERIYMHGPVYAPLRDRRSIFLEGSLRLAWPYGSSPMVRFDHVPARGLGPIDRSAAGPRIDWRVRVSGRSLIRLFVLGGSGVAVKGLPLKAGSGTDKRCFRIGMEYSAARAMVFVAQTALLSMDFYYWGRALLWWIKIKLLFCCKLVAFPCFFFEDGVR